MKKSRLREIIREEIQKLNEANGYDVGLFWQGLRGNDRKIGRFIVSPKVYDKLENTFKGHISIDLYDDTVEGKQLSYSQILKKIKATKYGKIAFKESKLNEDNKQKIIDLLIKHGNNKQDAKKLVDKHYSYVQRVYSTASNAEKAEIIRSL